MQRSDFIVHQIEAYRTMILFESIKLSNIQRYRNSTASTYVGPWFWDGETQTINTKYLKGLLL